MTIAPATTYRDRLRRARLDAGLDQRELAGMIGCSHATISAVETGRQHPSAPRMIAWAHACGVSLDDIARDES